jgi:hypothetical protein
LFFGGDVRKKLEVILNIVCNLNNYEKAFQFFSLNLKDSFSSVDFIPVDEAIVACTWEATQGPRF